MADIKASVEKVKTLGGRVLMGPQDTPQGPCAVVRDPRILILDDALSSVDTQTEEKILSRLTGVMRGRTTLLISHRVSTIRNADEIVVLHHGEIVEHGTHEELLALNGYYAELYNKQLIEEELEKEA